MEQSRARSLLTANQMNNENETAPVRAVSETIADAMRIKGINAEKLAQVTGISERFVALIVGDHTEKLPAAPYLHGYLVRIGEALGIDGEELWREFLARETDIPRSGANDRLPGNAKKIIFGRSAIIGSVAVLAILLYVTFRLPWFFGKPDLKLSFDEATLTIATSTFVVQGTADTDGALSVNGEDVYPNPDGTFSKTLTLAPGFNTVTVRVKRLLGAPNEIVRQVFFNDWTASSTPASTTRTTAPEEITPDEAPTGTENSEPIQ